MGGDERKEACYEKKVLAALFCVPQLQDLPVYHVGTV